MKRPALLLLGVLAILPVAPAHAGAPDDPPECKECRHLCSLMDQMLQHEAIAGFYWKFALKNPSGQSAPSSDAIFKQVKDVDFAAWGKTRPWPCGIPPKGPGKTEVDLTTNDSTENPPCAIFFGNDELYKGDTLDRFTKGKCDDVTRPTIKHEEKHQQDCKLAKAMNQSLYDNPPALAQSEFDANSLHAQILRQEIRQLINSSPGGCGWRPSDGQKNDPNSIPSVKQMEQMHARDDQIRHFLEMAFGPGD